MPTTRASSLQNRQASDNVPPQSKDVPPMSEERLYSYLGTLVGLAKRQAKAIGNNGQRQSSSYNVSSFSGTPYFFGTSYSTEARIGL